MSEARARHGGEVAAELRAARELRANRRGVSEARARHGGEVAAELRAARELRANRDGL